MVIVDRGRQATGLSLNVDHMGEISAADRHGGD
jgi:hypothetical protein